MAGEWAEQLDLFTASSALNVDVALHVVEPLERAAPKRVSGSGAIQDAGAELVANRRNRVRSARTWADLAPLNDALRVKETTKATIWPKPDYKQLIEDGMRPMVAHVVKQIYDSVAIKPAPAAGGMLDDIRLQSYVSTVNRIERGVMQWATDRKALAQWAKANAQVAGAMLGRTVPLSDLAGESRTLLETVFPEGVRAGRAEIIVAGGNKLLGALQPGYEEVRRAVKALDTGWPEKREAWEVQGYRIAENPLAEIHDAVRRRGEEKETRFYVTVDGYQWPLNSFDDRAEAETARAALKPFVLIGKRGVVESFASREEAVQVAKERSVKDRGTTISDKGERVEGIERVGVARRLEGEDISSERLMSEFGFKGVNFGNWMKTPSARAEAQLHLNHAFDSLHDLADLLNVPPKALALNGMLGLAIGAQGAGTYAAHFVPGVNEINLTRTSGAGSLAHEWGHALDHYYAVQAGLATAAEPFLTEHVGLSPVRRVSEIVHGKWVSREVPRFGDIRPAILSGFTNIVAAIEKRVQSTDEAATASADRLSNTMRSQEGWLKAIRRDFVGLEVEFDTLAERVRQGDVGDGHVAVSASAYISPVVVVMRDLYKQKHGRVYSLDNCKALQYWVNAVRHQKAQQGAETAHEPVKVTTAFSANAWQLDKEKGGKPYWSTKVEKFARAFDAFVSDALEARAINNGYLSHQGRDEVTVPMGAERKAINAAFRGLVDEVKTRDTERGVALFSVGAEGVKSAAVPRATFEAELHRMRERWPSIPSVTVVDNVVDLPCWAPPHCDGVYYNGNVFVVAGNIGSMRQFHKVMAHECILHHSLEEMLGSYGFAKLHSGIQALKEAGDPVVSDLAANIRQRYGALTAEDETREIVARAGEQCLDDKGDLKIGFGFMKSVFAGVANWLRDHGLQVPFTTIELQGLMHDAGQWVRTKHTENVGRTTGNFAPGEALHSFAGIRAENAPLGQKTGWTFGFADGKPRFEVSDNGVMVEPPALAELGRDASRVAGNIRHALLLDEYPQIGAQEAEIRVNAGGCVEGVCEGQYVGKILDLHNGLAVQKVGRGNECVLHTLSRLTAPVGIGDVVDIAYKDGRGVVGGKDRAGVER